MAKYTCETCQKVFSQKGHLKDHNNRKHPCKKDNTIEELVEKKVQDALSKTNEGAVKIDSTSINIMMSNQMDYSKKSREELIAICKEKGIKGYSGQVKEYIVKLLTDANNTGVVKNDIVIETTTKSNTQKLNMIDLFAGTGAFTIAFKLTNNVNVVFANDMVEHSKKIYDENFDHKLTLKNLNEVKVEDIPSHDILTGGFPCQPFSIAGLQEGFKDERSNVFWKILSIIDNHHPKCVILENVKNLLSHDEHKTFATIKENLENRGYYISYKVLNTAEITGIPQHRERIYIVCLKSKKIFDKLSLDFPKIEKKPVSHFLESSVPDKYYYTDKSSTWELITANVVKKDTIYQYRRVYVRENKSSECPTLTANMGGGGHNVPIILDDKGIRKLTPRECFNFQGFPSSYILPNLSDTNLYKLAGNAVSVPVVKLIANRIIPLLQED
jgi:DNA (cytosine-5)-methyltransferase 1